MERCKKDIVLLLNVRNRLMEDDKDLFVMVLADGERFGEVIWLAGGEIERFKSFMEFFESMIKYNEGEVERMLTKNT